MIKHAHNVSMLLKNTLLAGTSKTHGRRLSFAKSSLPWAPSSPSSGCDHNSALEKEILENSVHYGEQK
jgi:hypothetical protein